MIIIIIIILQHQRQVIIVAVAVAVVVAQMQPIEIIQIIMNLTLIEKIYLELLERKKNHFLKYLFLLNLEGRNIYKYS